MVNETGGGWEESCSCFRLMFSNCVQENGAPVSLFFHTFTFTLTQSSICKELPYVQEISWK